jgi:hypothetical protein
MFIFLTVSKCTEEVSASVCVCACVRACARVRFPGCVSLRPSNAFEVAILVTTTIKSVTIICCRHFFIVLFKYPTDIIFHSSKFQKKHLLYCVIMAACSGERFIDLCT